MSERSMPISSCTCAQQRGKHATPALHSADDVATSQQSCCQTCRWALCGYKESQQEPTTQADTWIPSTGRQLVKLLLSSTLGNLNRETASKAPNQECNSGN